MARNMAKIKTPKGLSGQNGLLLAVIAQAVNDATTGDVGAVAFFGGRWYKHIVTHLGLPADFMPVDIGGI
jgi:hypothetical protein